MYIKSAALTDMKGNLYVPCLTQYCSFTVSRAQATEQSHYNDIHHRFPMMQSTSTFSAGVGQRNSVL